MLKKIIYNLEEFAQHLVNLISNGSSEGIQQLDSLLMDAKKEYTLEDSLWWSKIYWMFRGRGEHFDKTSVELKTFTDPLIRLQEIDKFFFRSDGEWYITSANTRLLIQLINAVPGYAKEEDYYLHDRIIPDLIILIKKDIEQLIREHAKARAEQKAREEELQRIREGKNSMIDNVLICNTADEARHLSHAQPDKRVFYLALSGGKWILQWFDFTGKSSDLKIGDELQSILNRESLLFSTAIPTSSSRPTPSPANPRQIKALADKAATEYLNKTRVLINPVPAVQQELVSTFVIEGQWPEYQLFWFDTMSVKHALDQGDSRAFLTWLSHQETLDLRLMPQIKTWLQHMTVRREVDEIKQANVHKLLCKKHGITLVAVNDFSSIPKYRLLTGTYFLTQEEGNWVLYLRKKGGINAPIDLGEWPGIMYQLEVCKDFLPESIPLDKFNQLKKSIGDALEPEEQLSTESEVAVDERSDSHERYRPPVPLRTPEKINRQLYSSIISILERKYSTVLGAASSSTNQSEPRAKLNLESYSNVINLLKGRHEPKVVEEAAIEPAEQSDAILSRKMQLEAFFGSGRRYVPEELKDDTPVKGADLSS